MNLHYFHIMLPYITNPVIAPMTIVKNLPIILLVIVTYTCSYVYVAYTCT